MKKRIYVLLKVYNYDASPRFQNVEYEVPTEERAKHVAAGLRKLIGYPGGNPFNRTQTWLENHFRIYGFVDKVIAIFVEETRRI